jgi:hypothetical protein
METPRVAIIGAGRWGRNIIKTLASNPSTIAYVVHNESAETKAFLQDTYPSLPTTTDYAKVLQDDSVDAIIIATPINTHYSIAQAALAAGKHAFVEKPLALMRTEVADLYARAREEKCVLMTGYLYRFDPAFQALVSRASSASHIDLDFVWEKYGSFTSPITDNLLTSIDTHQADIFDATFTGDRGIAHVHIDRTKQARVKRITATIDGEVVSHVFVQDDLLGIELNAFLAEIQSRTTDNEKRQRIDESIAAVLEELRA